MRDDPDRPVVATDGPRASRVRRLAPIGAIRRNEPPTAVLNLEVAHAEAMDGVSDYRRAQAFFSPRNLDRISRWSASHRDFSISAADGGFVISSPVEAVRRVNALPTVIIPALPLLDEVRADEEVADPMERVTATDVAEDDSMVDSNASPRPNT